MPTGSPLGHRHCGRRRQRAPETRRRCTHAGVQQTARATRFKSVRPEALADAGRLGSVAQSPPPVGTPLVAARRMIVDPRSSRALCRDSGQPVCRRDRPRTARSPRAARRDDQRAPRVFADAPPPVPGRRRGAPMTPVAGRRSDTATRAHQARSPSAASLPRRLTARVMRTASITSLGNRCRSTPPPA